MSAFPLEALSLQFNTARYLPSVSTFPFPWRSEELLQQGQHLKLPILGFIVTIKNRLRNQSREADIVWDIWQTPWRGLQIPLKRPTAQLWGMWLAADLQLLASSVPALASDVIFLHWLSAKDWLNLGKGQDCTQSAFLWHIFTPECPTRLAETFLVLHGITLQ